MSTPSRPTSSLPLADWAAAPEATRRAAVDEVFATAAGAGESHAFLSVAAAPDSLPGGELAGAPFAVKNNIDVCGETTTGASPLLDGAVAAVDSGVVAALREAGGVVVGTTNMHELAFGVTSNNAAHGEVRNPHDPTRSAGGSSGGSAAAVALGAAAFSLGTDTGGSVTLPAAFCGVVGFRPTTGRYPGDGLVNLSWSRDTVGLHTRTVADAVFVDGIVTRAAPAAPVALDGAVVAVPRNRFADVDPEVAEAAERTLARLAAAGVRLVDVEIEDDLATGAGAGLELVLYEAERTLTERARQADPGIRSFADLPARIASPDVRGIAEMMAGSPFPAEAYETARAARSRLRRAYAQMFASTGAVALVAPSCAVLAPPLGVDDVVELNGRQEPLFPTLTRNTGPGTVAGVPMLTLPSGRSAGGLPIGMTYEGRFTDDGALLALGLALEALPV